MKKKFNYLFTISLIVLIFSSCKDDDGFFGDEIFNDLTNYPYVSIQDRNEDLEGITGNNFWGFELVSENNGNQVRIVYDSQDPNILFHEVYVGFENDESGPLESDVLITTINSFPTELIFTKEQIAAALNVPISDLETGSVFFRGYSEDGDGNVVSDPSLFEPFLASERHAYFYEWDFNQ